MLNTKILNIYNVSLDKVFSEASVYPYIFVHKVLSNNIPENIIDISIFDYGNNKIFIGFEKEFLSKDIIKKINKKSKILSDITEKIKRGIPNSKIKFDNFGEHFAIKSTFLNYPYSYSKYDLKILYNEKSFSEIKIKEFGDIFILLPRTVLKIRAILKDNFSHILDRIYYFKVKNKQFYEKYLLVILNSSITTFYYNYKYGSTKIGGGYIDLKGNQIGNFRIPNIPLSKQKPFIEKADFMLENNKILQEKINKFLKRLNSNYPIEKFSTKLKNFFELDFSEFVKELKKKKIVLSLKEQDEWEEYFEEYKKEIVELKTKIDDCDKEIDEMVFELYGLDEEERKVVLGE